MEDNVLDTARKVGGFRVSYKELKKCVMKKEAGVESNECKKIFDDLKIEHYDD